MKLQTFRFQEGTVIAEVDQWEQFDMKTKTLVDTGDYTAALIGGTAPGIKAMTVRDGQGEEKIFRSEAAAFKAAYQLAVKLGYHAVGKSSKPAKAPKRAGKRVT